MNFSAFALRNRKELLRDPLSLIFGIGLPLFLFLLVSVIQKSLQQSVPMTLFEIENFAPAIAVFSFSFISLFSGLLIAKDRSSSFLIRLFASPLSAFDYILGYSIPLLPIALLQSVVCLIAAYFLGLPVSINILVTIIMLIPVAVLFIGFGLLLGTVFSDKQVGLVASILIQLAALSSGMWFDLNIIGGVLKTICYSLPFAHAVDMAQAALAGSSASIFQHFWWVLGYSVVVFSFAVYVFKKKMQG